MDTRQERRSSQRVLRAVDPDFEANLENLISEVLDDYDGDDSDNDEDYEIESDISTDSEQEADEYDVNYGIGEEEADLGQTERGGYFYGKDKCLKWRMEQPHTNVRTRQHNIVLQIPGLRPTAKQLGRNPDIEEVWGLLFTHEILDEILHWTNRKIVQLREKYSRKNLSFLQSLELIELKAFIGLLVFTAVFKSGNETVDNLFATDGTGRDIFRCTMSKKRFLFILAAIRFDNPDNREERKKEVATAAISKIFNQFIENCQLCYTPGTCVCIDEMLVPFRGRCKFRMYMPKKPAKYGLKVMCMTDARTQYLCNAYIYSGKGSDGQSLSEEEMKLGIPSQFIVRLTKPIQNTRRNVTADNWFSSIEVVKELSKRGLTYVGTLKKNKKEIPAQFQPHKTRETASSIYGFTEDMTLLSYVPKKSKAVILVSSMHHSATDDPDTGKPEIISFYNLTKGGVDGLDQKCANYTSSRRTRRWPMAIFFTIIDVGCGVNAYVLHQAYANAPKMDRLDFMKNLAKSLVYPQMQKRLRRTFLVSWDSV